MTRERLHQMVDLVLACSKWGKKHRADITIDNDGDHQVSVYINVGERDNKSSVFVCDETRFSTCPPDWVRDPNFDAAEAVIRQSLMDLKGVSDDS